MKTQIISLLYCITLFSCTQNTRTPEEACSDIVQALKDNDYNKIEYLKATDEEFIQYIKDKPFYRSGDEIKLHNSKFKSTFDKLISFGKDYNLDWKTIKKDEFNIKDCMMLVEESNRHDSLIVNNHKTDCLNIYIYIKDIQQKKLAIHGSLMLTKSGWKLGSGFLFEK